MVPPLGLGLWGLVPPFSQDHNTSRQTSIITSVTQQHASLMVVLTNDFDKKCFQAYTLMGTDNRKVNQTSIHLSARALLIQDGRNPLPPSHRCLSGQQTSWVRARLCLMHSTESSRGITTRMNSPTQEGLSDWHHALGTVHLGSTGPGFSPGRALPPRERAVTQYSLCGCLDYLAECL